MQTRERTAPARWTWAWPLALAILPFLLFAPATVMSRVFAAQDVQAYFYPYHAVSARLVAQGHLPLWNPYVFSGIPLLGDGQTAMFYPPNWLFFVLPPERALNLVVLLQFGIAGAGMFAFARVLGLWRVPSFVAGLTFMFGAALSARVVHLSIMSGAALIPVILACTDRLLESRHRRARGWCAATAAAIAVQLFAGHPQVPVYTALAVGLYALVRTLERATAREPWDRVAGPLALGVAAYALGAALAAVQLVPWVELAGLSIRAAGTPYEFVFRTSTTGAEWLLFLFPYLLGAHASSPFASGPFPIEQAVRVWEHSAYIGMLPLGLALVGVGHLVELIARSASAEGASGATGSVIVRRRFSLVFVVLLVVIAALMAAGWHTGLSHVIYAIPVLGKLRAVERVLVLAAVGLTMLAGFGMQRVVETRGGRGWVLGPAILVLLVPALFVVYAQLKPLHPLAGVAGWDLARLSPALPHTYVPLMLAAGAALLLAWWSRAAAGTATQACAIGLVLLDLGTFAVSFTPMAPRRMYRARPQAVSVMASESSPFRKATVLVGSNDLAHRQSQHTLAMSWGMVHGIEDVNGFNSLQPRRYTDYLFGPRTQDVSYGYLRDERLFRADNPVLSSLNVRFVLVPREEPMTLGPHLRPVFEDAYVRVYENTLAYPRAFFADRVRTETDPRVVLRQATAAGFDGRHDAIVETAVAPSLPAALGEPAANVSRDGPNELSVTTTTTQARFLVVSEMYFPGWRAYLDGVETTIYRTNYLFRGIVVPAGRHTVTFVYRPASVMAGAVLSAVAALILGFLAKTRSA